MASGKRTPKVSRISRSQTLAYARKKKSSGDGPEDTESDEAEASDAPPAGSQPAIAETPPPATTAPLAAEAEPEPAEYHRARVETVAMPVQASIGSPPEMPAAVSAVPPQAGAVEEPTQMPGPREVPGGHPDDPAAPPGRVPPGDSRSMRRRTDRYEFALVYRIQTYVISRVGVVGTRGQWRVVEYPTPAMASHAYAKECSRFVSDGFSDYRE